MSDTVRDQGAATNAAQSIHPPMTRDGYDALVAAEKVRVADEVARYPDVQRAAWDEVARLCQPGERWRMTIPVDAARDSDVLITKGLRSLTAERDALAAKVAAVETLAQKWCEGDFGWEGYVVDQCGIDLRAVIERAGQEPT